jgi:hypothetical protein
MGYSLATDSNGAGLNLPPCVAPLGSWEMCLQDLRGCFRRTTAHFKTTHIELAFSIRLFEKLTTQHRTPFDAQLELTRADMVGLGRIVRPAVAPEMPMAPVSTATVAALAKGSGTMPSDQLMNFHEKRSFIFVSALDLACLLHCVVMLNPVHKHARACVLPLVTS